MNTILDVYRGYLHNSNKEEAPAMYPSDFSHFYNMAVNQVVNKFFNTHDINIQSTDNLKSLVRTVIVDKDGKATNPEKEAYNVFTVGTIVSNDTIRRTTEHGALFLLPDDYYHIRNCIAIIDSGKKDCDDNPILKKIPCKRLTADMFQSIIDDYFQRPTRRRPYYYIQNNSIEIRWGFEGDLVYLEYDYLKEPLTYELTEDDILKYEEEGIDQTPETGFSRYVNYEILKEVTAIIFGRDSDPRVQVMPAVNQSLPN